MNTNQLFEAIGEVDSKKLLHSERSLSKTKHPSVRLIGILAAVLTALTAFALVANAATKGLLLNELRMWLNGEPISSDDPRISQTTDEPESDFLMGEAETVDNELIAAKTNENGEFLTVKRYHSSSDGQSLGLTMQVNHVEEVNGRMILFYGTDRIDITDQLRVSDCCSVDYSIFWDKVLKTHLMITVQRGENGAFYVFSEPAK